MGPLQGEHAAAPVVRIASASPSRDGQAGERRGDVGLDLEDPPLVVGADRHPRRRAADRLGPARVPQRELALTERNRLVSGEGGGAELDRVRLVRRKSRPGNLPTSHSIPLAVWPFFPGFWAFEARDLSAI
jgi:hypothetical protein